MTTQIQILFTYRMHYSCLANTGLAPIDLAAACYGYEISHPVRAGAKFPVILVPQNASILHGSSQISPSSVHHHDDGTSRTFRKNAKCFCFSLSIKRIPTALRSDCRSGG